MAGVSLDGRHDQPPAERATTEHLSPSLPGDQYRLQPSVQPARGSHVQPMHLQPVDQPESRLGQDAVPLSSSAHTHFISHLPAIRTSVPMSIPKQEAADSRSNLSEADTFEPGSIPTTAHSSPLTPPCQVQPAFPLTPPPAPVKQCRAQRVTSGFQQTAAELLGHPSAKRSLQPAFDAAAAQAGLPLYGLQPFEPLVLDDIDPGLHTPHFPGAGPHSWQRRQRGREASPHDC